MVLFIQTMGPTLAATLVTGLMQPASIRLRPPRRQGAGKPAPVSPPGSDLSSPWVYVISYRDN